MKVGARPLSRQAIMSINERLRKGQVPSEVSWTLVKCFQDVEPDTRLLLQLSRTPRDIDMSNWKASEYLAMSLFYFPIVWDALKSEGRCGEAQVRMISLLLRAYCLPDKEYKSLEEAVLSKAQDWWYESFQRVFGEANCTYNVHLVSRKLSFQRKHIL